MNLNHISYQKKNQLLIAAGIITLILAWQFAVKNTFTQIALYQQLNLQTNTSNAISHNPRYIAEKANLLNQLSQQYTQDSTTWKNQFWLNISTKVANKANIIYQANAQSPGVDTNAIAREQIAFNTTFKNLVLITDTLQKAKDVGFLTSISLKTPKDNITNSPKQVLMQAVFSIVKK